MKFTSTFSPQMPNAGWQLLGELWLPAGISIADSTYHWLVDILHPLGLHTTFQNAFLKSVLDNVAHSLPPQGRAEDFPNVHLHIFAAADHSSVGEAWGFFRIEKITGPETGGDFHSHDVKYYLYPENPYSK